MKWITDGSLPKEDKKLLFVVGEKDVRFGVFLLKDKWDRTNQFCDGSYHDSTEVIKWAYVTIDDETPSTVSDQEAASNYVKSILNSSDPKGSYEFYKGIFLAGISHARGNEVKNGS